jgi:hypothetical protein
MVAVSQAPSPESNPNSPLPVTGKVVNYTTFNLIGGKFIQHRSRNGAFATFACVNNVNCPRALIFVSANCTPHHTSRGKPNQCLDGARSFLQVLAIHFEIVIPSEEHMALLRWADDKPFNEPYTDFSA